MKKMYYQLWYRLDNKDRYLIWYSEEEAGEDLDGVLLDSNGMVPILVPPDRLSAYAQTANVSIEQEESNLLNLDIVVKWIKVKRSKPEGPTSINCSAFLAAWILFADVSRSIGGNFNGDDSHTKKIYHKLFWGNNLPSMTPQDKFYVPLWSKEEKRVTREIMSQGLQMFRNSIKC